MYEAGTMQIAEYLQTPFLTTERLLLVLHHSVLAPWVSRYYVANHDHFREVSPRRPEGFHTESAWAERAITLREESLAGRALQLLLITRDDPRGIAGHINFTNLIRDAFQACYLGYGLDRQVVGSGLLTEALSASIPYVFETLGLHRIMANYIPTNERSGRVLRRLGFNVEGYARDDLQLDDVWKDHIMTALTRPALR
ncbi:MAG: GNAT family N-acetyltransferase [Polyangiales bacterium]